jgi:hypothetical protein
MPISFYSFGWTFGIGLPVLGLFVWLTRRPEGRSWVARVSIATVAALMITPTIWSPFGKTYVEAAALVLFCGVVGLTAPAFSFLIGGLPVMLVAALIYGVWHLSQRRAA